jgi:ubiquinone/menaquinone biosynthesis C-methylase UbiE
MVDRIDDRLVRIEQRKLLIAPWTISARRFTSQENKQLWNEHDWSSRGEEWTRDNNWKQRVIDEFLLPHVPVGAAVVEIGPGGGRWTELLQARASRIVVVDVSERALQLCRERFARCSNIEFLLGDGHTIAVPDASVDVVWSFDVFVHVNPIDARNYFREFNRVLKPGGHGMIHHAGTPSRGAGRRAGWRSDLTSKMVLEFLKENELHLVSQIESDLVNADDALTVFAKRRDEN